MAVNPFSAVPGYGEYAQLDGTILTCPVKEGNGAYRYWFAMGFGDNVAISRIGYPNGNQLASRVVAGARIRGGFDLSLVNEQGNRVHVEFSSDWGRIDINGQSVNCSVRKTTFVI